MQIQRSATILLSQQPMRPSGVDTWVQKTRMAMLWIKANSMTVRSSVGVQTWELISALASIEKVPLLLLVHAESEEEYFHTIKLVMTRFDLDNDSVTFRSLLPNEGERYDKDKFMQERDRLIVLNSDVIIPVSIRPKGVMSGLVQEAENDGKPVINSWRIKHKARQAPLGYQIDANDLTNEILTCEDRYLVHWTRATNGAWPNEQAIDFYRDIIQSQRYPRSSLDTLNAIIRQRRIIASARHMPGNIPCVCFSALTPSELLPLIRWRSRYRQMSFEPYGIGIDRETATEHGIQPVNYYKNSEGYPPHIETWLTQSSGVKSDWRLEREYRHLGDFDLSEIPKNRLACFCRTREEALQLSASTGINTIPFTD
jgi:hypothetical protein